MAVWNRASILNAPVALAIVALFCALLSGYHVASYDGTDENGYLVTARSLATKGDSGTVLDDPNEFVSGNYVLADNGNYYGKYPLGYPYLCALAYNLGGPSAVFLVNPILAALAVLGTYFLGRAMISSFAGALAAILLATNPLHAYFGLSALSHSGSICFAVWGMFFLWRWTQSGGKGERAADWRIVSIREHGALYGWPVTVADCRHGVVAILQGGSSRRPAPSRPAECCTRRHIDDAGGGHRRDAAADSSLAGIRRAVDDGLRIVR